MADPSLRKPRVGFVKSRTGCRVCKIRRIKCDETKPNCVRCTSSGRVCEGYSINKKPIPSNIGHALVPKPGQTNPASSKSLSPGSSASGHDEEHARSFWEKTAGRIRGCMGFPFWEVVCKTAQQEQSINSLVLAIGALNSTTIPSSNFLGQLSTTEDATHNVGEHHLYALHQYENGLKILRESYGQAHFLRTSLIASILIIFFEGKHGDHESASQQFFTGLELIRSSLIEGQVIEDEIFHAFRHLHLQISLLQFLRLESNPERVTPDYFYTQVRNTPMPASFSHPRQARLILESIVAAGLDFVAFLDISCYARDNHHPEHSNLNTWAHSSPVVFNQQEQVLDQFRTWREAFDPLFRYSRTSAGQSFGSVASALEAMYLAGYISTASAFFQKQTEFDAFTPYFTSIVNLCSEILHRRSYSDETQSGDFSLDSHVVCPLFIVGFRCREPTLRREAISLLASLKNSGQGLWSVNMLENLLLWIMSVEEDGIDGNFVREESRVWDYSIVTLGAGIRRTKFQLFFKGFPGSTTVASVVRETVLDW